MNNRIGNMKISGNEKSLPEITVKLWGHQDLRNIKRAVEIR